MTRELGALFAKRFIQRRDVKAVQLDHDGRTLKQGDWFPDTKIDVEKQPNSPHLPVGFKMSHLEAHIAGERTYGHYLLDEDSKARVFVFDIDLKKEGNFVQMPNWADLPPDITDEELTKLMVVNDGVFPRQLWVDRSRTAAPARNWYKYQMKTLAHILLKNVSEMGLECAAAYSGSKGVHVYGFTGEMPGEEVRAAADICLARSGEFKQLRGKNFFEHVNDDPIHGLQNFDVEVFPKQESLEGKNFGNLVRLPLGKNWKNPKDPTFFLDMTTPLGSFTPHSDPVKLLEGGNPFV